MWQHARQLNAEHEERERVRQQIEHEERERARLADADHEDMQAAPVESASTSPRVDAPSAAPDEAPAAAQSEDESAEMTRAAEDMCLPQPLVCQLIVLEEKVSFCVKRPISYTDCMECSVLRFMQAMLADSQSLTAGGTPTRVDLSLVRRRVRDATVRSYFERFPSILPAGEYNSGKPGFEARQTWARLMNRKAFFTYKRSSGGVYKNDALEGRMQLPPRDEWQLELEPCVHNVIAVLRYFLGVDFSTADVTCQAANHGRHRGLPWQNAGEAHIMDVTAAARVHLDTAMRQLSRPGMQLGASIRLIPPNTRDRSSARYHVRIDIDVNGEPAWKWVLDRRWLKVVPPYDAGCARDSQGPIFMTSVHSQIHRRWR